MVSKKLEVGIDFSEMMQKKFPERQVPMTYTTHFRQPCTLTYLSIASHLQLNTQTSELLQENSIATTGNPTQDLCEL